jgi:asparagine synthase (glutamine-hydrolysing)
MACGLEVRPPLLDHELLELAARIPSDLKVRRGETKWIFKQAYRETLGDELIYRKKHGFDMPIDAWLRGPLRDMFESAVLEPQTRVAGLVHQETVRKIYRAHLSGIGRHGGVLWSLLVLARWAERYLGSSRTPAQ